MDINLSGTPAIIAVCLIVGTPAAIVMAIFAAASNRYKKSRFKKDQTVIAEYVAPGSLSPAEIGYLFRFKASMNDIYGTIFDLERRGFLQVYRSNGNLSALALAVDSARLKIHENYLFDYVVQSKEFTNTVAAEFLWPFSQSIRQQLKSTGYLKGSMASHYLKVVIRTTLLMLLIFPFSLLLLNHSASMIGVTLLIGLLLTIFVYPPAAFLLSLWYTRIAGHAWMGTSQLKTIWPELLGYQSYIKLAELDEIRYSSDDIKTACQNSAFAYAVAFGLKTNWQAVKDNPTS